MANTKIEWTEMTWNPTTGCTKISSGCQNCYAEKMAYRLQAMGIDKYKNGFQIALHEKELEKPYGWKNPRNVFVNSMSDLFHEKIPFWYIQRVFEVMNDNPQHTFQVLTKRSENLLRFDNKLTWTPNIWMGVTVEDRSSMQRIDHLKCTSANIKFLSCEPLLSSLSPLELNGINWVIVGGESGNNARPVKDEWIYEIKEYCENFRVPFFFKQWGGKRKKKNGRLLNGKEYNHYPVAFSY